MTCGSRALNSGASKQFKVTLSKIGELTFTANTVSLCSNLFSVILGD